MDLQDIFKQCEKTGSWYGSKISSLDQKNFLGDTPFHTVCSWGEVDLVKNLIDAGADVNARGDLDATPLFNAIISESYDVVKLLLDKGANKNLKNENGQTPLQYAINTSAGKRIVELLKKG